MRNPQWLGRMSEISPLWLGLQSESLFSQTEVCATSLSPRLRGGKLSSVLSVSPFGPLRPVGCDTVGIPAFAGSARFSRSGPAMCDVRRGTRPVSLHLCTSAHLRPACNPAAWHKKAAGMSPSRRPLSQRTRRSALQPAANEGCPGSNRNSLLMWLTHYFMSTIRFVAAKSPAAIR